MEKELLKDLVDKNLTTRQIGKKINISQTTVVYWLKKFELKTNKKENRVCPKCRIEKTPDEFYNRRGKIGASTYCKKCNGEHVKERQQEFKQKCVEYKKGKCENCGYNKCSSALEFHHINPKEKKFEIKKSITRKFDDNIKKELDKCMLLCANCHREIHNSVYD